MFRHISKIGLEIEGGWFTDKRPVDFKHDSSVRFHRRDFKVRGKEQTRRIDLGEVASRPLESIAECANWIKTYWPDKKNGTCGFHIHISLKNKLLYSYLMDKEFNEAFLHSALMFGRAHRMSRDFFHRLEGKNRYCKKMFKPEEQLYFQHNHQYTENNPRYAQLNYCFSTHGTVENRLPTGAMPKGKAIRTVEWYVDLVESYLDKKEDKPILVQVEGSDEETEEIDLTNYEFGVNKS